MNKLIPTIILLLFITTACTQPPVTEEPIEPAEEVETSTEPTEPTEEITFENATYLRQKSEYLEEKNEEFKTALDKYCGETYEEKNKDEFYSQLLLLLTEDETVSEMIEVCVTESNVYVVFGEYSPGRKVADWNEQNGFTFYENFHPGIKTAFYPEVLNGDSLIDAWEWDHMYLWRYYKLDNEDHSTTLIEDCILEPDTPPPILDCEIQYTP